MAPPAPYDPDRLDLLRQQAKAALRKRLRGLRASFPRESLAQRSQAIAERVFALDEFVRARTVALFRSIDAEVDTAAIIARACETGKRVALPVVLKDSIPLEFRLAWEGSRALPLTPGVWGIEEPDAENPVVDPNEVDLVIVPALAVDPTGHRLGYGRGHYDHTLPRMRNALRVVVAFDFQLLAEIPAEPHDVTVHRVVTDQRTLHTETPP